MVCSIFHIFQSYPHIESHSGWWYTYPSEKREFVSWDDDIPNLWKVLKFTFQTTNQYIITIFYWQINYFNGHFPVHYVCLPEGR